MLFNAKKTKENEVKKSEQERLAEKREQILARGKKFKYPLQFSKHRTMIVTIFLATFALVMLAGVLWIGLYKASNTGDMMFRVTKLLPLPAAEIDGEKVRYSDYLLIYRSSLAPIEQHTGKIGAGENAEAIKAYYKRSALQAVEDLTYALKLARETGIEIGADKIEKAINEQRSAGGATRSEASFLKVLKDNFGLTKSEYERLVYLNLVKAAVAEKIDNQARETAEKITEELGKDPQIFNKLGEKYGEKIVYEETGGLVDNVNVDGGRAAKASSMEVQKISEKFVSSNGDGYYFVKTLEKTEKKVSYASVRVPFREFERRVNTLRQSGAVKEYINL